MCVGQWVSQWVAPGASVTSGSVISPAQQCDNIEWQTMADLSTGL